MEDSTGTSNNRIFPDVSVFEFFLVICISTVGNYFKLFLQKINKFQNVINRDVKKIFEI